jgi:hypothetical protein
LKKKTKKTKKILTKRGETFSTLETTLGKNEVPYKPVFLPIKSFDLIVIVPQKVYQRVCLNFLSCHKKSLKQVKT